LRGHKNTLPEFTHIYKQINAPFGRLALASLKISTAALASDTANDAMYNKIATFTAQRDAIAEEMRALLDGAAFKDEIFDEVTARHLTNHAEALLEEVSRCAANVANCAK
jgi:hypothetical protein